MNGVFLCSVLVQMSLTLNIHSNMQINVVPHTPSNTPTLNCSPASTPVFWGVHHPTSPLGKTCEYDTAVSEQLAVVNVCIYSIFTYMSFCCISHNASIDILYIDRDYLILFNYLKMGKSIEQQKP